MKAKCGNEKSSDALITVELEGLGVNVEIESKVKSIFGKQIEKAVLDACKMLSVENALISVSDYGALDFVIRSRTKTAIRLARKQVYNG